MTNPNAYEKIVPRAIPAGGATVKPFDFAVRTLLDYDMDYLTDRVHATVFVNGQATGIYGALRIEESPGNTGERADVLDKYGPVLERVVLDEFFGMGFRQQVRDLERQVRALEAHRDRIRWWQLRRRWAAARRQEVSS